MLAAALLAGCAGGGPAATGGDPAGPGWGDGLTTLAAAITVDHEAVLTFHGDFSEVPANLPVTAGGTLKVVYDPARLPDCRATKYGFPAWSLLLWYQFDGVDGVDGVAGAGGPDPAYAALAFDGAMMTATLAVPEDATELTLYFQNNDAYGCNRYDSNLGANYVFEVSAPAVATPVVFAEDWTQAAGGPIRQGGQLRVAYAPQRLQACRYSYNGARAWNLFASWAFAPGGQTGTVALYEGNYFGGEAAIAQPVVPVPADATSVSLWFSNSDATGCAAWDSDYGANYTFPVVPADPGAALAVGWAGDWDFVTFANEAAHYGDVDPAYYFDSWAGAPSVGYVEVQVWVPGLTDQAYASPQDAQAAAAAALGAEAVTDALDDGGGWGAYPLKFERQQGNNFVYSFRFAELRWSIYGYNIPDGLYHYYARFSTNAGDAGATWFETGKEGGLARRFVVAPQQDCALFPDNKPPSCPQDGVIGWAGTWGAYRTHACAHTAGLEDPITFTKSAAGHDCMVLTAEVYAAGITDAGAQPSALLAQVVTDVGYQGGPLAAPVTYPLAFDGVAGNNFRYRWDVSMHVSMAARDDYAYTFRFSADGGQSWFAIGQGEGPLGGGARTLRVRNDSSDVDEVLYCDGLELWQGQSMHTPTCVDYPLPASFDANFCELWVNALGWGNWSHSGTTLEWLEAYVNVGAIDGGVRHVGMWVRASDGQGAVSEHFSLGSSIEPGYFKTGFTFTHTGPGSPGLSLVVEAFAFFVDVERPSGAVERLWQSAAGANYTAEAAFAIDGWVISLGSGTVEYADESVGLFDQKKACAP
jgi:hypothetical protein